VLSASSLVRTFGGVRVVSVPCSVRDRHEASLEDGVREQNASREHGARGFTASLWGVPRQGGSATRESAKTELEPAGVAIGNDPVGDGVERHIHRWVERQYIRCAPKRAVTLCTEASRLIRVPPSGTV
jgi:hypothetical protein